MATNINVNWAEIGVSGGEVDKTVHVSLSFDLSILIGKIAGSVNNISAYTDIAIPVAVKVTGSDPYTITFTGKYEQYEIEGTIQIGVENGTMGTCNYSLKDGNIVINVTNATAVWVQQPK